MSLESIISKAVSSIAGLEDRVVNGFMKSRFFAKHPVWTGALSGFTTFGLLQLLESFPSHSLSDLTDVEWETAFLTGGLGLLAYLHAKIRNRLLKQGIDYRKFDEISSQALLGQIENKKKFPGNIWDNITAHPRTSALICTESLFSYAAIKGSDYFLSPSLFSISTYSLANIVLYLAFRKIFVGLRYFFHSGSAGSDSMYYGTMARLLAKYTGLNFFKQAAINQLKRASEISPSFETKIALADTLLYFNQTEEGLLATKEAAEAKVQYLPAHTLNLGSSLLHHCYTVLGSLEKGTALHSDYIAFSLVLSEIGRREQSLKVLEDMTKKFPGIESYIFGALMLDAVGQESEGRRYWSSAASAIASDTSLQVLPVSERGIHNVRRYGPSSVIASTFVFKEKESFADLAFEKNLLSYVRSQLSSCSSQSGYTVPQVIAELSSEGHHELILRYLEGESPVERQRLGKLRSDDLVSIADYLCWIHRSIDPQLTAKGKINFDEKLEQILQTLSFQAPFPDKFSSSLYALLEAQKSAPFVFAKDPHPAQWRFGKEYLAALDWDDMGVTSLFVDAAKLYAHPDVSWNPALLDSLHGEASVLYRQAGFAGSDALFRLHLLDAMLYQSLSFAAAWSSSRMSHMHGKRHDVLSGASHVFELLRANHPQQYASNKSVYATIESEFQKRASLFAS